MSNPAEAFPATNPPRHWGRLFGGHNAAIPERDEELKFQDNTEPIGKIGCQQWLGGLIKSYHREAA